MEVVKDKKKVSKTEQEVQNEVIFNQQKQAYAQFCNRVKAETADSEMRIKWLSNKKTLLELEQWAEDEKTREQNLIKNVIKTLEVQCGFKDVEKAYIALGIELPLKKSEDKPETKSEVVDVL